MTLTRTQNTPLKATLVAATAFALLACDTDSSRIDGSESVELGPRFAGYQYMPEQAPDHVIPHLFAGTFQITGKIPAQAATPTPEPLPKMRRDFDAKAAARDMGILALIVGPTNDLNDGKQPGKLSLFGDDLYGDGGRSFETSAAGQSGAGLELVDGDGDQEPSKPGDVDLIDADHEAPELAERPTRPPSFRSVGFGGTVEKRTIQQNVRARMDDVRRCYNEGLEHDPTLGGRVAVQFRIDRSGDIANATVASSTTGDGRVDGCIRDAVDGWSFRLGAHAGDIIVTYPFVLSRS